MYRVWYSAMIDRESDGRFIGSIPDLGDLAGYGDTDKDAVVHVTTWRANTCGPPWKAANQFPGGASSLTCGASLNPLRSAAPSSQWKLNVGRLGRRRRISRPSKRCPNVQTMYFASARFKLLEHGCSADQQLGGLAAHGIGERAPTFFVP
jgi:hypothetical protein